MTGKSTERNSKGIHQRNYFEGNLIIIKKINDTDKGEYAYGSAENVY